MAKYQITARFSLDTQLEPEFHPASVWDIGAVEEFSDESAFRMQEISCRGGEIKFQVEADSEESAEDEAREVVFDGQEVEDTNGFTWEVNEVEFDIDEIEPSMDIDEAISVLSDFAAASRHDSDESLKRAAFAASIVMDDRLNLVQRTDSLMARLDEANERITGLSRRLQEVEDLLAGRTNVPPVTE